MIEIDLFDCICLDRILLRMRSVLAILFWICRRFASSRFLRFGDICFVKHMFARKSRTYVLILSILLETQVMRNVGSCHRKNWSTKYSRWNWWKSARTIWENGRFTNKNEHWKPKEWAIATEQNECENYSIKYIQPTNMTAHCLNLVPTDSFRNFFLAT